MRLVSLKKQCLILFRNSALDFHNAYRSIHGVSALVEVNYLDDIAQAYADKLAANFRPILQHSDTNYGENIGFYYNSSINPFDFCSGNKI